MNAVTGNDIPMPLAADPQMMSVMAAHGASQIESFETELQRAGEKNADALREQVKQLVAETFITPILKMARNDPFKSDLFHGGSGEDLFHQQLDQEITKRMGDSMNLPFVETAYKQFARQMDAIQANKEVKIGA